MCESHAHVEAAAQHDEVIEAEAVEDEAAEAVEAGDRQRSAHDDQD